jgi:hypothetical protein
MRTVLLQKGAWMQGHRMFLFRKFLKHMLTAVENIKELGDYVIDFGHALLFFNKITKN